MFEALIEPLSCDEFVSRFWDKDYLYVDGTRRRSFDAFIAASDIDEFLSRTDIRHPSLRLVKDGLEVPLHAYTRELKLGAHVSEDLIDNEKVFQHFNEGATIVLQFLQHNIPRFGTFTNQLEEEFACNVHGSCFITPPNSQGFTAHYDTYSFFVLQILGEKLWNIYPATPLQPIREDRVAEAPWTPCEPTKQILLKPGDFLYVPRGVYHSALTNEGVSIHMSLGFFAPTWLDIIRSALCQLHSSTLLRRTRRQPNGELDTEEIEQVKGFLLEKLDLQAGLQALNEDYFARRVDGRRKRLLDLAALPTMHVNTRVAIQKGLPFRLELRDNNTFDLIFSDKKITLPQATLPTIRFVELNGVAPIGEISDTLTLASRMTLMKRLVEEGFLTSFP